MSEYLIQGETLTGIADAIRGKTGGTDPVAVSDMAAQIEGIQAGGGDIDALIERSITEINSNATTVGKYAFYNNTTILGANFPKAVSIGSNSFESCTRLTTINFPAVTRIGINGFYGCSALTEANFPSLTSIEGMAFQMCNSLPTVNFPKLSSLGNSVFYSCISLSEVNLPEIASVASQTFYNCRNLKTADFLKLKTIRGYVFYDCSALITLIIRNAAQVASLSGVTDLTGTPIASGTGYIYVPYALIEDYKAATNWSTYASQFRALEDYTVDGTTTGELDPAKTGT